MSLRVMIVIHSLRGGGAERVAADLSRHWADAGRTVMVVTQTDDHGDVYPLHPDVQRETLTLAGATGGGWRGITANFKRVRALRRLMVSFKPDVVLGMMTTASVLSVLAARGLPCAVVATEHTHPPSQRISGMWRRLRRWTYPRADRVVALTSGTARWLNKHVPGAHLDVIPNPVHWPLAQSEPHVTPPPRNGRRRALAVGRLHPDKGFETLVTAFKKVAAAHPEWDLIILGEGAERARLTAHIAAAGLSERVLLPGRVGNVGDWYAAADLYVLSSRFEGLSNTLLESMASGLAAAAFDCDTGPREIVREGVDGVLVRPNGDVNAMAQALDALMADDAHREALGARAIEVRERFSPDHVLSRWQKVFDDARAQAAGRASL